MSALRALLARSAPLLACLGLLGIWQVASLILSTDSFPTAWEAIRTIPSILGDKESLINILASLRRMAIGFGLAVVVSIPLGLMMGRSRGVASFFNPLLMVTYPVPKAALITMVTSEMIARQSGAGNILFNALDMGQYDTVYAMIIIIGAMGIGLDAAFEKIRGRLVKWSEPGFDIPLSFA